MRMNNEWTRMRRRRVCKFLLATNFKYVSCYVIFLFNPLVSHFLSVSYYFKHNSQPICEQALVLLTEFFIVTLRVLWSFRSNLSVCLKIIAIKIVLSCQKNLDPSHNLNDNSKCLNSLYFPFISWIIEYIIQLLPRYLEES